MKKHQFREEKRREEKIRSMESRERLDLISIF